jgi:hypothetical protein
MKLAAKLVAGAVLGLSGFALSSTAASAAIVCNAEGDCWHAHHKYNYAPEFGVTVHADNWKWGPNEHYNWREHSGRGYWKNGVWIKF